VTRPVEMGGDRGFAKSDAAENELAELPLEIGASP
jgi:hypothetical protein